MRTMNKFDDFLRNEMLMIKTIELYDMSHTLADEYLQSFEYPWQALDGCACSPRGASL